MPKGTELKVIGEGAPQAGPSDEFQSLVRTLLESKMTEGEHKGQSAVAVRLWDLFLGYRGVKPSESLGAFDRLTWWAWGKPKETIEVKGGGFIGSTRKELIARAMELSRALKGKDGGEERIEMKAVEVEGGE